MIKPVSKNGDSETPSRCLLLLLACHDNGNLSAQKHHQNGSGKGIKNDGYLVLHTRCCSRNKDISINTTNLQSETTTSISNHLFNRLVPRPGDNNIPKL